LRRKEAEDANLKALELEDPVRILELLELFGVGDFAMVAEPLEQNIEFSTVTRL